MSNNEKLKLAKDLIEEYCKREAITLVKKGYSEIAEDIINISYSKGGSSNEKELRLWIPAYFDTLKKKGIARCKE